MLLRLRLPPLHGLGVVSGHRFKFLYTYVVRLTKCAMYCRVCVNIYIYIYIYTHIVSHTLYNSLFAHETRERHRRHQRRISNWSHLIRSRYGMLPWRRIFAAMPSSMSSVTAAERLLGGHWRFVGAWRFNRDDNGRAGGRPQGLVCGSRRLRSQRQRLPLVRRVTTSTIDERLRDVTT